MSMKKTAIDTVLLLITGAVNVAPVTSNVGSSSDLVIDPACAIAITTTYDAVTGEFTASWKGLVIGGAFSGQLTTWDSQVMYLQYLFLQPHGYLLLVLLVWQVWPGVRKLKVKTLLIVGRRLFSHCCSTVDSHKANLFKLQQQKICNTIKAGHHCKVVCIANNVHNINAKGTATVCW